MKLLSSKIFAGYLLVIIVLAGFILFFTYQTTRRQYIETVIQNLTNLNYTITDNAVNMIASGDYVSLDKYVNRIGKRIKTRITIIKNDGTVVADSWAIPSSMNNHAGRPEVAKALHDSVGNETRRSVTLHNDMLYVAVPVDIDGRVAAVSRVSLYLSDINHITNQLADDIIRVAVFAIFIALAGVMIFTRRLSRPIALITNASKKVAKGEFDAKVKIKGRDEIKDLADNFNFMTAHLKELFEKVTSQKEEFSALISSIQEGLFVTNHFGMILLANKSFRNIYNNVEIEGKYFWEVVREPSFAKLFNSMIARKQSFTSDLRLADKYFLCSANYIESKNEIVFLLHDITVSKRLEQIKKDFIINASHELRTPLTAIKGFVETLEEETTNEDSLHYIDIIKRHTNRLVNIVQDLLTLSELEEDRTKLMKVSTNLKLLLENVVRIFEPKIEEKKLYLDMRIAPDLPEIMLDNFRIEQVFVNLIDNAIKYTDYGGVTISAVNTGETAVIEVADSGIGIPREDQQRVFERFYTVDKSRSRKVGGTGLGLSIVKHIIMLHKGTIAVESKKGAGTKFIITLPLK